MDKKLLEAVQAQINAELYSAYLYLSMSSWSAEHDCPGFSNWLRVQAKEELAHAMTLHDQLLERGEASVMKAIAEPPKEWPDLLTVFEDVLKHEKTVTASINEIANIAMKVKDHAFYDFIMMFVKEQVEEEDSARKIVSTLTKITGNNGFIYQYDKELGSRVFVQPFTGAN